MASEKRLAVGGGSGNKLTLRLEGTELIRQLKRLERKLGAKIARKTLRAAGRPILNDARRRVAVDTGELKASLKIRTTVKKYSAQGRVQATAPHAHLVELGTKPHYFKGKKKGSSKKKKRIHPGTSPQPFLRPAYDSKRPEAIAKAREVLKAAILSVTKGA